MKRLASFFLALMLCFGTTPAFAYEQSSDADGDVAPRVGTGEGARTVQELLAAGEYVEGSAIVWASEEFSPIAAYSSDSPSMSMSDLYELGSSADDGAAVAAYAVEPVQSERIVLVESATMSTEELLGSLAETPGVIMAEPDYVIAVGEGGEAEHASDAAGLRALAAEGAADQAKTAANAPDPNPQYFLKNIGETPSDTVSPGGTNAYAFWDAYGALDGALDEVVVAVLDSGVDYTHPDLKNRMWEGGLSVRPEGSKYGYNCADGATNGYDPMDSGNHGTHVAGIVAAEANNGYGGAGVAPNAKIMALRISDAGGTMKTSAGFIAYGYMKDACKAGVNLVVANNSWGGPGASSIVARAIEDLYEQYGVLSICATGNESANLDLGSHIPSNYPSEGIIAVDAIDNAGSLADFSNFGAASTDLAAPGADVVSTVPESSGECNFRDSSLITLQDDFQTDPSLFEFETAGTAVSTVQHVDQGADGSPGSLLWKADAVEAGKEMSLVSKAVNLPDKGVDGSVARYLAFQTYYSLSVSVDAPLAISVFVSGKSGEWIKLPGAGVTSSGGVVGVHSVGWLPAVLDFSQLGEEARNEIDWENFHIKITRMTSSTEEGADLAFHIDDMSFMTGFNPYGTENGTSQATPAVSGAAALLAGAGLGNDASGNKDASLLRARILGGVLRTDALAGRCTSEGQLDIMRAATSPYPVVDALVRDSAGSLSASVEGSWFGDDAGRVLLDGVELHVSSWSGNRIEITLPEGLATEQRFVQVERADGSSGRHLLLIEATDEKADEGLYFESLPAPDLEKLGVEFLDLQDESWLVVPAGGKLYATAYTLGAGSPSEIRMRMLVFDPVAESWSVEPAFNDIVWAEGTVLEASGDVLHLLAPDGMLYRFDTAERVLSDPIDCSASLAAFGVDKFSGQSSASVCDGSSLTILGASFEGANTENEVLRIDLQTGEVVRLADIPSDRITGSGEIVGGEMVLVGGASGKAPLLLADTVDIGTGASWTSLPVPDAVARNQLGTVAAGVLPAGLKIGGLAGDDGASQRERLIVAGLNGSTAGDPDTYVFDPVSRTWLGVETRLAPMKLAYSGGAVLGDAFYVLGFDSVNGSIAFKRLALAKVPVSGSADEETSVVEPLSAKAEPLVRTGDATVPLAVTCAALAVLGAAGVIAARRFLR